MAPQFKIIVRDLAGAKVAEIDDYLYLVYVNEVNDPGMCEFGLPSNHSKLPLLIDKYNIEVRYQDLALSIPWYTDFQGIYRATETSFGDDSTETAAITCPGKLEILSWREILYYAGVVNRSQFTNIAGETIMKTLVSYNASTNATTANGRMRTPATLGITVAADLGRGTLVSTALAWGNLLAELKKIALMTGGDFDLIRSGAAGWSFEYYPGQRGTDRTSTVTFAVDRHNISRARSLIDHTIEKSVAIVGGSGEGSARVVQPVTGSNYAAGNDIEIFVNANNESSTTILTAIGNRSLAEHEVITTLTADVAQADSSRYLRDYFLGDLAKVVYGGITQTHKISRVSVSHEKGGERKVDVRTTLV